MTAIHNTRNVPASIRRRFELNYGKHCTFDFYWYRGFHGKCYGANVYKNRRYWANAFQIYEH